MRPLLFCALLVAACSETPVDRVAPGSGRDQVLTPAELDRAAGRTVGGPVSAPPPGGERRPSPVLTPADVDRAAGRAVPETPELVRPTLPTNPGNLSPGELARAAGVVDPAAASRDLQR